MTALAAKGLLASTCILAFIDAPDPDNLVMLLALRKLFPNATVHVVLTGRPVKFYATKRDQKWDWDKTSSLFAQRSSAQRLKNFLRKFRLSGGRVFDGGIAPQTLVSHHLHFAEYQKFGDVDTAAAIQFSQLENQDRLVKLLLSQPEKSVKVAVGGPMTGLHELIQRCPQVVTRFQEVHAMFATWGEVSLMDFGGKPRGAKQFNVACDPQAAYAVLKGLDCPLYLMPTEVTRVPEIGFATPEALSAVLPRNAGTRELLNLYIRWYEAALKPRQEMIFIHDLVAAFSLDAQLRDAIYEVVPIEIVGVPHLAREQAEWGAVGMKRTDAPTMVFSATGLKPGGADKYIETLRRICATSESREAATSTITVHEGQNQ